MEVQTSISNAHITVCYRGPGGEYGFDFMILKFKVDFYHSCNANSKITMLAMQSV